MFTLKINGLLLLWKEKSKKVATENSVEKNKNGKGNPITSTLAHYFQTAHCKRRVEKKKKKRHQNNSNISIQINYFSGVLH